MKLTEKEKAALRAAFHNMSLGQKLEYVWEYYKGPILLGVLALAVLFSVAKRQLTKKETVLSLVLVNVAVGDDLGTRLTHDFLTAEGYDSKRQEINLYPDLYISEDANAVNHEYAYASRMKLNGAISARMLDVALMNREAYDILSQNGFLLELSGQNDLPEGLRPYLRENEVVLSDNSLEVMLGEAEEEQRVTEMMANALAVETLPLFREAGFDGELYLGIITNSQRLPADFQFLHYIAA